MITKNKQSPSTLYLLNPKTQPKQQQRKSARLTFNNKKSSRSISQYQKWNATKDVTNAGSTSNIPFQPSGRMSSQIKKIVLSKNQFTIDKLQLDKKLSAIIDLFQHQQHNQNSRDISHQRLCTLQNPYQRYQKQLSKRKSQQPKSGQISMISLGDRQRQHNSKKKLSSHHARTRTQSTLLNHSYQQPHQLESIITRIDKRFKMYDRMYHQWKSRYQFQDCDYLLDTMIKSFKTMFGQMNNYYMSQIMTNLQYFQESLTGVAKQYQSQISQLKQELTKADNSSVLIKNLVEALNEKHQKGIKCSKIFEDMQKNGNDVEQTIKKSKVYKEIVQSSQVQFQFEYPEKFNNNQAQTKHNQTDNKQPQRNFSKQAKPIMNSNHQQQQPSDEQIYQQQRHDFVQVQDNSNWNRNFQNRQSIKGVLKYINHPQNNTSSTITQGYMKKTQSVKSSKSNQKNQRNQKYPQMKIDNWKSFISNQNGDKTAMIYKKIMSQR